MPNAHQMTTVEDVDTDWADIPLFAPAGAEIPNLSEESAEKATNALGALSHLLHDEETPEEKSELHRCDGNRHFKIGTKRALRLAVDDYSKAVEAAEENVEALSSALNNRAAAHLKLGNYGHALDDAMRASKLTPSNIKAHYRAAVAATHLERVNVATRAIEAGLKNCKKGNMKQSDINALKQQMAVIAKLSKKLEEREQRRVKREQREDSRKSMFSQRGIQVSNRPLYSRQREYERTAPQWDDESGNWCWPLLLIYPTERHGEQSDYLASVNEDVTWRKVLELVFGQQERPWWDVDNAYSNINSLEVLLKIPDKGKYKHEDDYGDEDETDEEENGWKWTTLNEQATIGDLVKRKDYIVPLYPVVHIISKDH